MKFKLTSLIDDFKSVKSVRKIKDGVVTEVPFDYVGGYLYISSFDEDAEYHLSYLPKIDRISKDTPSTRSVKVDDRIAYYIPYFIMGELYKHDEPNMAAEMRNEYEQYMLTMKPNVDNKQTEVEDDMGWFHGI